MEESGESRMGSWVCFCVLSDDEGAFRESIVIGYSVCRIVKGEGIESKRLLFAFGGGWGSGDGGYWEEEEGAVEGRTEELEKGIRYRDIQEARARCDDNSVSRAVRIEAEAENGSAEFSFSLRGAESEGLSKATDRAALLEAGETLEGNERLERRVLKETCVESGSWSA